MNGLKKLLETLKSLKVKKEYILIFSEVRHFVIGDFNSGVGKRDKVYNNNLIRLYKGKI